MAQNGPNVIERDFKDRGCIASKLLRTVNNRSDVMAHLQSSNFMVQGLKNESRYTQGSSSFFFWVGEHYLHGLIRPLHLLGLCQRSYRGISSLWRALCPAAAVDAERPLSASISLDLVCSTCGEDACGQVHDQSFMIIFLFRLYH